MKFLGCIILLFPLLSHALKYEAKQHDLQDILVDQGYMFTFHTVGYLATQWDTIRHEGSVQGYKDRFLTFRFDSDAVTWNYFGHGITGAQVYLFYRARGYSQNESLYLSFLSSLWFEVFIENYTENPSFQDTFHTPIFGSVIGHYTEKASVFLINSDNRFYRIVGRIINPFSFLVNDEKNMAIIPYFRDAHDFKLTWSYYYD